MITYSNSNSSIFLTDKTKGINLSDLKHLHMSKVVLTELHIPLRELEKRNNWYELDGKKYFVKRRALMQNIINELLGEYVSKYMNLATVHQSLLLDDDKIIGLVSENFRKKGIKYVKADCLTDEEHCKINKVLLSRPTLINRNYKRKMYDYLMRNFYTNQCDRMNNVLCYYHFNRIYLAELYDYEMSFISPEDYRLIDPYFMGIDITTNFLAKLLNWDANLQSSVDKIRNFDMQDALDYLENYYKIIIPDDLSDYYLDYDQKRKRLINDKINK